ncbi:MAG TPA: VWA domain-containing protein [Candidatus Yonathbacteria bacterium]|nr:VWA domain-containing protein [Candidatus Yonathbacteria bacterium]
MEGEQNKNIEQNIEEQVKGSIEPAKPIEEPIEKTKIPASVWSTKRKFLYLGGIIVFVLLLSVYPLYKTFKTTPTCFDNKQNQGEVEVDRGGPCPILANSQVLPINILWGSFFKIEDNLYDIAALIENRNTSAGVENLDYTLRLYDEKDELIEERSGTSFLNPSEQALLFEPNIGVIDAIPTRVEVDLGIPIWVSAKRFKSNLVIKNKTLTATSTSPRLTVTVGNNENSAVQNIEARALIYDTQRNIIAISSTYIEALERNEERKIFFTWPNPIKGISYERVCSVPVDVALVFDRSGSMNDDGSNPPQPITSAKKAAKVFIDNMQEEDNIALVSFATDASIDQQLTANRDEVVNAIDNIAIGTPDREQHTNLGDAILKATVELLSDRTRAVAKKAMVILTDGIASRPLNPDNANDEKYPETYAEGSIISARDANMLVYVIGLGANVNKKFLEKNIATTPTYYFGAATASELNGIYKQIAQDVCLDEAFITEILLRTNNFTSVR